MKLKKFVTSILVFTLVAILASGCAKRANTDEETTTNTATTTNTDATTDTNTNTNINSNTDAATTPDQSNEEVNQEKTINTDPVQIWIGAGASDEDFNALAEKYKNETGIDVEVIEFTDLSAIDKLALDGPAGNGGDIYYQGGGGSLGKAIEQGLFMEITSDMTDLSVYTDAGLENYNYKGKLYGIPTGLEVPALLYNKAIISEIPDTWEEFIELVKGLNDFDNDKYGFLMDIMNPYFTNCFTDAFGGYIFKLTPNGFDVSDIGINNDGAKKAFEMVTGYVTKDGIIPKNMEFALMQQNFKDGKVGAIIDGPWSVSSYQEAGIDLGVAAIPKVTAAGNAIPRMYSGAYGYCISAYAKNPVGAMQFIEYIAANVDNAKVFYDKTKRAPALKALNEIDEIKNDPIQGGFSEQAVHSFPQPNIPQMDVTWGPLMEAAQAVVNDGYDISQALDLAAEKLIDSIAVMEQ